MNEVLNWREEVICLDGGWDGRGVGASSIVLQSGANLLDGRRPKAEDDRSKYEKGHEDEIFFLGCSSYIASCMCT